MMKKIMALACLFVLGYVVTITYAGDDLIFDVPGGDNNPATNEDANACFSGGSLAGKCLSTDVDFDNNVDDSDIHWMWTCGWYLIRFESGDISRTAMQGHFCEAILPPLPEQQQNASSAPAVPATGCVSIGAAFSIDFAGGYFLPFGAPAWNIAGCPGAPNITLGVAFAYVPAPFSPLAFCNLNGAFTSVIPVGGNIYQCIV